MRDTVGLPISELSGTGEAQRVAWRSPLAAKHPALVAGVLDRDHARGRDDSTVVVARDRRGRP